MNCRWRYQKNLDNGQEIGYNCHADPDWCPVKNGLNIRERALRLNVKADQPIAVYKGNNGKTCWITNEDIEAILQMAAKTVHNITDPKELKRFTAHSIRVGAAVDLQAAGKNGDFIKIRLRWKSKSYMLYLRNVPRLADAHNVANNGDDYEFVNLEEIDDAPTSPDE